MLNTFKWHASKLTLISHQSDTVDETMAPLDPASKSQVMAKLKAFCKESIVLVIYHTDVGASESEDDEECVPSNSFFDYNLHVENKHLTTRPVC